MGTEKAKTSRSIEKEWPKPTIGELGRIHGLDPLKIRWSQPMELKELAPIFNQHRNTISGWLKNQNICNQQLSARRWRVATHEFPDGF